MQKTLPTSHIKIFHLHRYNKIASRVQKKRTKRSSRKNTEKHDKENKHRARKKRQATTSVSFGLGKNNTYFRQLLYPVFQYLETVSINYLSFVEIIIQRRSASNSYTSCGSPPCADKTFNKGWSEYRNEFGSLSNDYWIGLDQLYNLTNTQGKTWGLEVVLHNKLFIFNHLTKKGIVFCKRY